MKVRKLKRRGCRKTNGGPIGRRCKEDSPGCIICDAWHFKDTFGRFPYGYDELRPHRRAVA